MKNNQFKALLRAELERLQNIQVQHESSIVPSLWYANRNRSDKILRGNKPSFMSSILRLGKMVSILLF